MGANVLWSTRLWELILCCRGLKGADRAFGAITALPMAGCEGAAGPSPASRAVSAA